mmetsp:Transcript_11294/g.18172  ORF Transcript_11294/g.18172 Transcript_11294/m.18172 type:complete len:145 (+) Transcript_11294:819-1253(+)
MALFGPGTTGLQQYKEQSQEVPVGGRSLQCLFEQSSQQAAKQCVLQTLVQIYNWLNSYQKTSPSTYSKFFYAVALVAKEEDPVVCNVSYVVFSCRQNGMGSCIVLSLYTCTVSLFLVISSVFFSCVCIYIYIYVYDDARMSWMV